ncbi:MAG: SRPBCC family protein [Gammaproteobacteria bacterium]|nr:SRPBCC family protein [Gammaproteobacteria bacterium]
MSEMKVDVERDMAHPAAKVWAVLANFGDLSWAPGTERVEVLGDGIGMTRRIYMPGMDPIDEVLEALDNEACQLRYSIPRGLPMPLDDYQATVRVEALPGGGSRIHWSARAQPRGIDAATASGLMHGSYAQMLDWLDTHLGTL